MLKCSDSPSINNIEHLLRTLDFIRNDFVITVTLVDYQGFYSITLHKCICTLNIITSFNIISPCLLIFSSSFQISSDVTHNINNISDTRIPVNQLPVGSTDPAPVLASTSTLASDSPLIITQHVQGIAASRPPDSHRYPSLFIVNLSDTSLTEDQIKLLNRGLGFCPTPGPK